MRFSCYIMVFLSFTAIFASDELGIEVQYVPPNCTSKTMQYDRVYVRYTGSIDPSSLTGEPGMVFDSNVDKPSPFEFYIGKGTVILGWDQGMLEMCVGERRILKIPPELGYGSRGFGKKIPRGIDNERTTCSLVPFSS
jgi:FK506-binding protein 2